MGRFRWSAIRAAAEAVINDALAAEEAQAAGRRHAAAFHRWRAARRATDMEIAARQHRGLDYSEQAGRYHAMNPGAFVQ